MKTFRAVVREIRWTVAQVIIIPSLLNGVLLFLALYLFLEFFALGKPLLFALVGAMAYTIFLVLKETGMNQIRMVEKYYPGLREKLRTAADYADVDDLLVNELHKEVMGEVRSVAMSTFVNKRALVSKIAAITVLCFLIVSLTQFDVDTSALKLRIRDKVAVLGQAFARQDVLAQNTTIAAGSGAGGGINPDIFGEKSLALLGKEAVNVELRPNALEFRIGEVKEAEKKEFQEVFPVEIALKSAATYDERIPKEQQELVKNYFRRIAEG